MKKKKILFVSNLSSLASGFGRHNKQILTALFKTGKYDLVEYGTGGVRKNDPILNRFPWKAYGAWPEKDSDLEPMLRGKTDEERQHLINAVAHGVLFIDEVIEQERPDVLYFLEDIWQISMFFDKPWWNTIPTILHTPIDSLPLLKIFSEQKDKLKNLWVKAEFPIKPLQELGIEAKFFPAIIEHNNFYPIKEKDRNDIRNLYGINDTCVIGFVARNQLRKLFPSLMEGFKLFKNKNPEAKVKLFFHTDWSEPGGWRIEEERERLGISKDDILTTYVCSNCKGIRISPFKGRACNCNRCNTEGSVINPNLACGVTEEELNAIYNILDGLVHVATSGGFEMPILEAMLAGVPVATCAYAFGEMFVNSGVVEPIDFTFFREGTSQFHKSNPSIESIAETIQKFYENQIYYKERGLAGREWALKKFDPDQYIKQFEEFVDNSVATYTFKTDDKNKPVSIQDFILTSSKKRLLYIMPENGEDCFISLSVIKGMREVYKEDEWDYYIATRPEFFEIFEHLNVANLIPYHPMMDDFKILEGHGNNKGFFDIAFHPYVTTSRFLTFHHNGLDIDGLQNI